MIRKLYDHVFKIFTKNKLVVSTTTAFFRNDAQMETIIRLKPDPQRIYVFGCSEGCEAYSFAIHLRLKNVTPPPRIIGYDINVPCIEKARGTVYEREHLNYYGTGENADPEKMKFFLPEGSDKVRIDPSVASTCEFHVGSVLDEAFMSKLPPADIVFCQNVLIHLNPEQNRLAVKLLKNLVAPNGLLAIGGMQPQLRSSITTEAALEPVTDNCQAIHDGWRELREWWDKSRPWARDYFALEPFSETSDWPHRYSSLFRVPTSAR